VTIGVAFLSAWTLDAPAPCVWALADNTIAPTMNAAADRVNASFTINPPLVCRICHRIAPRRGDNTSPQLRFHDRSVGEAALVMLSAPSGEGWFNGAG
jgi:hypothetical protein